MRNDRFLTFFLSTGTEISAPSRHPVRCSLVV